MASHERDKAAELMQALSVLALERTAFSSERAMMAWIRTAISLYTFGFSISKFIDYLALQETGIELSTGLRRLGIALIIMGIVALVLATTEHLKRIRRMRELGLPRELPASLPVAASGVLLAIGIAAVVSITTGWPA